jgi:isopenicillin N synthase-like dioxygenase
MSIDTVDPISISWNEICQEPTLNTHEAIEKAFGYNGLGILVITDIPNLTHIRLDCLPLIRQFAHLPIEIQEQYEHPISFYNFGWSCGREMLKSGKVDKSKGSYYFRPYPDEAIGDIEYIKAFPSIASANVWPRDELVPGFAEYAKKCALTMISAAEAIAKHTDSYVSTKIPSYKDTIWTLEKTVKQTQNHKARLLFYFPKSSTSENQISDLDDACGWHNDHSSLTALLPALFFDDTTGVQVPPPSGAGLYVRTRQGKNVRIRLPANGLAFQIGETAQILSGGILQATPHCVRSPDVVGISRATMAVFHAPPSDAKMAPPIGADTNNVLRGASGELLPPGVPPMISRWKGSSQSFGEWTNTTLAAYH